MKSLDIIKAETTQKHSNAIQPGERLGTHVKNGLTWTTAKVGGIGGVATGFVRGFARGLLGKAEPKKQIEDKRMIIS